MADDVKVKFGGDFSGITDGAGSAAKMAGNAFSNSFDKFGEGMISSISSAISIENIVNKIKDGLSEAAEYFKQIGRASKVTGMNPEEIQRVLALGKPQGINDIETVTKALGIYSQNISLAAKGSEKHRAVLRELGFTQEQITAGTITATEALAALAKQNEGAGKPRMAANLAALFGAKSGKELKGIVQAGSSYIKDTLAEAKIFTGAQVEITEAAERVRQRREGFWKKMFRTADARGELEVAAKEFSRTIGEVKNEMSQEGKDLDENASEFSDRLIRKLQGRGFSPRAIEAINKAFFEMGPEGVGGGAPGPASFMKPKTQEEFERQISEKVKELESAKPEPEITPRLALTASSLQQIGGGDISSVLAASYQSEMLSTTQSIDTSIKKLVENNPFGPAQPPAKAGR